MSLAHPSTASRTSVAEVEATLCGLLVDRLSPGSVSPALLDQVWAHATLTSVDELLATILCRPDEQIAAAARQRAVNRLRDATAREMLRFRVLRLIVDTVDEAGLRVLLMKGAGLAYAVYPEPHLRPAGDIDLFIARDNLEPAETAIAAIGFRRCPEPDAELASMQRHYALQEPGGIEHVVDLHWRIANRHVFAGALSFDEAWPRSQPVPRLGAAARTLGTVDALLLACIHRVAHHDDHPDLLWIWDIHLLASRMTPQETESLLRKAADAGMRGVLARGLELAHTRFDTTFDSGLLGRLRAGVTEEPSARFLTARARQVDLLRSDLAAAGSLGRRMRLLREHLFPALNYMRSKYPRCPGVLLPLAYVHRIARGAPHWFTLDL